jgi:hypothetical protein
MCQVPQVPVVFTGKMALKVNHYSQALSHLKLSNTTLSSPLKINLIGKMLPTEFF